MRSNVAFWLATELILGVGVGGEAHNAQHHGFVLREDLRGDDVRSGAAVAAAILAAGLPVLVWAVHKSLLSIARIGHRNGVRSGRCRLGIRQPRGFRCRR